jgi:hypothetical protein
VSFPPVARRLGIASASVLLGLQVAYGVTLAIGLALLPSAQAAIADPMFTVLELLILAMAPAIVLLMIAIHAWAPVERKPAALAAVVFAAMLATVTCMVHAVILVMSRHPAWSALPWAPLVTSFTWPSVAYVLDILAWDVFFALSALCAAAAFGGPGLERAVRVLLSLAGALALAGLVGAALGDMGLRNIGIVGYLPVFAAAVALIARVFARTPTAA